MNKLKTFNEWMNEPVTNEVGTERRFVAFHPERIPHPIILADHVWNECAKAYTLRLDTFLTQFRILAGNDPRLTSMVNQFKEEMVKTMISNSVPFQADNSPIKMEQYKAQENSDAGPTRPSLKLL